MRRVLVSIWFLNACWIELLTSGLFIAAMFWGCSQACGQTYQLDVKYSNGQAGIGSAVCVGKGLKQGQWVFLTAGHVLNEGKSAKVEGQTVRTVNFARGKDLASFEISAGQFEKTAIIKDWPDGINAMVCGYGDAREAFCFEGSITRHSNGGRIWAQNQHTVPGDSGGAVMVQTGQRRCLAGIHWGYGCDRGRCDSEFVTSEQICQHLTQIYGDCPDCQQWPQIIPRAGGYPSQPPAQQRPLVSNEPDRPPRVVVAPCQDDLRKLVAEYMAANPVQDGRNGEDGRTPDVDYEQIVRRVVEAIPRPRDGVDGQPGQNGESASVAEVAQYLVANHKADLTGPAGQRGEKGNDGQQGLVGVPSSQDIQNWLVGAMSDPDTRLMMSQLLVELAAEDPGTTDLIQRLEQLENRKRSQRVLIVDSQGNVLDDETFNNGEPIVLNVRQFTQSTTQP